MKHELDALAHNMAAPASVRFSQTALTFVQINEDTLAEAGSWLQRVEGCRAWWWGDFLCAYCEYALGQEPTTYRLPDERERRHVHYTARYAAAAGAEPETLSMWRCVSQYYRPQQRHAALSFGHHAEAYKAHANDKPAAQRWLARAKEHGWSVSQLRAAIRLDRERAISEEPRPTLMIHDVLACARWANAKLRHLDEITDDVAMQLLREFEPIERLLSALRERACNKTASGPSHGGLVR